MATRSLAAQARQASYYDARRRDTPFAVGDKVWEKNRVLSSAAKGIAAKLAPKFSGPYWILEARGSNSYRLVGADGVEEALVHAEHLKPHVGDDVNNSEEPQLPEGEGATSDPPPSPNEAQLPREERATADPPPASGGGSSAPLQRPRGRPRKTTLVAVRQPTRVGSREAQSWGGRG